MRSNSEHPSDCSSSATSFEAAGWERFSRPAALWRLPASEMATNSSRCRSFTLRLKYGTDPGLCIASLAMSNCI